MLTEAPADSGVGEGGRRGETGRKEGERANGMTLDTHSGVV